MFFEAIRKEGMRRGLSPRTIKTYSQCVQKFLRVNSKELKFITKKDVENYLFGLMEKGRPGNTINVYGGNGAGLHKCDGTIQGNIITYNIAKVCGFPCVDGNYGLGYYIR